MSLITYSVCGIGRVSFLDPIEMNYIFSLFVVTNAAQLLDAICALCQLSTECFRVLNEWQSARQQIQMRAI